ncbi:MAG: sugar transferase [archaeon]
MARQSIARRLRRAVRQGLGPKPENRKESLARRIARGYVSPKQQGLNTAFKDGWILHKQVRIGKRGPTSETFPKGKPNAIVITKFRTMKRGAHADYETDGREPTGHYTAFGRWVRKLHLDELLQLHQVAAGKLKPVGMRPVFRPFYRRLPPKLREMYDEMGPGLLALPYACKSKKPTAEEIVEVVQEFYEMWKENPAKANRVFAKRILKGARGKEIVMEEIFK